MNTPTSAITAKKNNNGFYAWLVWGLAAAFYFYECLLQVSPGVMVQELMQAFNVNAAGLGHLTAFYFYAYAGMQIPVGVLLDHYGPRRLLVFAALVCMMGCLLFGYADGRLMASIGRFLIGFGSAFAVVGSMKLASNWFPLERFSLLTGLLVMLGMLGAVGGETPLALLVSATDWRHSMIILGIVGGLISLLIWLLVRDNPPSASSSDVHSHTATSVGMWQGLKQVIRRRQNWVTAIYGGLMFAPTSAFGALWGVPFLIIKYGISRPAAAGIMSFLFIGWAIGSPVTGWISDMLQKRLPTMIGGTVFALVIMLIIIYVPNIPLAGMSALLFFFGFFSSGFLSAFSITREINPNNISATALGFMNMLNMVGGALLQPFIGYLLDRNWTGETLADARVYSLVDYHLALAILPAIIFIALLLLPFIKETNCKVVVY